MIEISDDGAQRPQADVARAGAITDDMPTPADLGGAAIWRTAKACDKPNGP